jgi:hypothetical protein
MGSGVKMVKKNPITGMKTDTEKMTRVASTPVAISFDTGL